MGNGTRPSYYPPPLEEVRLRRVYANVVPDDALEQILSEDKWYQKLKSEIAEIQAIPRPNEQEVKQAWEKAVQAYWVWIHMSQRGPELEAAVRTLEGQVEARRVEVRKTTTLSKIHAIREKLGRKFMANGPRARGLHARPLPLLSAHALLNSLTAITSLPPPPLELPPLPSSAD